jgi:hypothetical protein
MLALMKHAVIHLALLISASRMIADCCHFEYVCTSADHMHARISSECVTLCIRGDVLLSFGTALDLCSDL